MADFFSIAFSLVALVGFAFQTSKALHLKVESSKSSKRMIRELGYELESLIQAVETLEQAAKDN
ncbi:uncharacterized protein ASPGLDRAFT_112633, partial [Aspergillus glaucus CBS 516.65]